MSGVARSVAVAAPHPAAVGAAEEAVRRGGNAVDAALAAATVLTVVYPHQCALGGDLIALVRAPGQAGATAVVSAGAPPMGLDVDALTAAPMPRRGIRTVTTPGVVGGWTALADLGALLPLGTALDTAAAVADDGIEISAGLARGLKAQRAAVLADPGLRGVFASRGDVASAGDTLRQPALAATLRELAAEPDAFYRGAVAARLAAGLRALGGDHTAEDLAAHRPEIVPAIEREIGDGRWWVAPPPSQGALLLGILPAATDPDRAGREADPLVTACVRGIEVRDRELGDPRGTAVDVDAMVGLRLADGVSTPPAGRALGDTVAISAVDSDGLAVCLIQSVFQTFGAGLLEPGTGIVLHNRGAAFSTAPSSPGYLRPGTRPPHTLCPAIAWSPDRLIALGCQGGRAQAWILAQVACELLSGSMAPGEVLARPRWVVGARDLGYDRTVLLAEPGVPHALAAAAELGLPVIETEGPIDEAGHVQAAVRTADGHLRAATDPRADGRASVVAGS
ncbi:gamma-glutamyltransferase [Streptomyces shenzhenensis]|uniref:gamma-glutamyltransferase n=1 Tax=Streptomyces shenzhenensis TaxID=943815 RepID=UPI00382A4EE3